MKQKVKRKNAKEEVCCCTSSLNGSNCSGGAVYGLGFIGAVIYYISTATGFWDGILGFLKALVWPVFLVKELLMFIGA